jgi:hypothetical protein
MKNQSRLLLIMSILMISNFINAADQEVVSLPSRPAKIMSSDDSIDYPTEHLRKVNDSYRILHTQETHDQAKIREAIVLLVETAEAGDPISLEELANMALCGQYNNIPKNIEWGIDTLIYLIKNGEAGVVNTLNAINQEAVRLLETGQTAEARRLFIKTWVERG